MSEAKKYDRSYKEQSVKPALEIGVKRAGEELKVPYGTLYGWVQAAKKGIYTDTTKTKKSQRTQKYPQYVMDMLWKLRKEQDEQCAGIGDKWQDCDRLFIKWDGSPMNNNTPYFWFKEFCKKNSIRFCDIHSLRHLHASMLINAGVDVVAVSADLGTRRLQRQRTSTVICSKKHRQGRAGQSPTHLSLTKKKSRAAKKPNFLLKNHKFKIRTSAVTEIKDFEQQREPCCFAIKTK